MWNVGDDSDFMFMGKSGRNLHVFRAHVLVEIITPGSMVGYLPLFVNRRRESRCVVSDDDDESFSATSMSGISGSNTCTILRLDRKDFIRLKAAHPAAAEALMVACIDRTNSGHDQFFVFCFAVCMFLFIRFLQTEYSHMIQAMASFKAETTL